VLFDLDGTLVDFKFRVLDAKRAIFGELFRIGLNLPGELQSEPTQTIFEQVALRVEESSVKVSYLDIRKRLNEILDFYECDAFSVAQLRQDANNTLESLKNKQLKIGLVTNDGVKATSHALSKFNLSRFFDVVVTRDDVQRLKPRPDGIINALNLIGVPRSDAIFIGDSSIDIMAAKEAGIQAVAIAGGAQPLERLKEFSPHYSVRSLSDLLKIIS
jgi:HAD superfamily hydrolase (TIGR01549 family)